VRGKALVIIGLDLAGSPKRPTGFCLLRGLETETRDVYSDEEILAAVAEACPDLVAIDAPLHLPPGRSSIHERNDSHYRPCDLELRKRKIPFFPITLGPMRGLTERGMRLRAELEANGIRTVEMYPGGAQDVWRIPRAARDKKGLRRGLAKLGLKDLQKDGSNHELDAATGALVGRLFLQKRAEVLGDFDSGAIILPRPKKGKAGTIGFSNRTFTRSAASGSSAALLPVAPQNPLPAGGPAPAQRPPSPEASRAKIR
jgi:predicted nuclease with RNAse H fold